MASCIAASRFSDLGTNPIPLSVFGELVQRLVQLESRVTHEAQASRIETIDIHAKLHRLEQSQIRAPTWPVPPQLTDGSRLLRQGGGDRVKKREHTPYRIIWGCVGGTTVQAVKSSLEPLLTKEAFSLLSIKKSYRPRTDSQKSRWWFTVLASESVLQSLDHTWATSAPPSWQLRSSLFRRSSSGGSPPGVIPRISRSSSDLAVNSGGGGEAVGSISAAVADVSSAPTAISVGLSCGVGTTIFVSEPLVVSPSVLPTSVTLATATCTPLLAEHCLLTSVSSVGGSQPAEVSSIDLFTPIDCQSVPSTVGFPLVTLPPPS